MKPITIVAAALLVLAVVTCTNTNADDVVVRYGWINRTMATGAVGPWVDGVSDAVGLYDDDATAPISLPFPIALYDRNFTSAVVGTNGNIQFASDSATLSNELPNPDLAYAVLLFQGDMSTGDSAAGQGIFSATLGVAPNRLFVLEYRLVLCCDSGPPTIQVQASFFENSSSTIRVVYGGAQQVDVVGNAVVGVQSDPSQYTIALPSLLGDREAAFPGARIDFVSGNQVGPNTSCLPVDYPNNNNNTTATLALVTDAANIANGLGFSFYAPIENDIIGSYS